MNTGGTNFNIVYIETDEIHISAIFIGTCLLSKILKNKVPQKLIEFKKKSLSKKLKYQKMNRLPEILKRKIEIFGYISIFFLMIK